MTRKQGKTNATFEGPQFGRLGKCLQLLDLLLELGARSLHLDQALLGLVQLALVRARRARGLLQLDLQVLPVHKHNHYRHQDKGSYSQLLDQVGVVAVQVRLPVLVRVEHRVISTLLWLHLLLVLLLCRRL